MGCREINKTLPRVGGGGLPTPRSVPVIPSPEFAHFAFRLFLIPAVAFLQLAGEDFRLTFELVDLVVGQLAPLLFDLAFQLREIAFRDISIHLCLQRQVVIYSTLYEPAMFGCHQSRTCAPCATRRRIPDSANTAERRTRSASTQSNTAPSRPPARIRIEIEVLRSMANILLCQPAGFCHRVDTVLSARAAGG